MRLKLAVLALAVPFSSLLAQGKTDYPLDMCQVRLLPGQTRPAFFQPRRVISRDKLTPVTGTADLWRLIRPTSPAESDYRYMSCPPVSERFLTVGKDHRIRPDTVTLWSTRWVHDTVTNKLIFHDSITNVVHERAEERRVGDHVLRNRLLAGGAVVALTAAACVIWCPRSVDVDNKNFNRNVNNNLARPKSWYRIRFGIGF